MMYQKYVCQLQHVQMTEFVFINSGRQVPGDCWDWDNRIITIEMNPVSLSLCGVRQGAGILETDSNEAWKFVKGELLCYNLYVDFKTVAIDRATRNPSLYW